MSLLLKDYKHSEELTLVDFVYLFLTKLNRNHATTYENGEQQCRPYKHRSLGDITEICKSYYPETTREEVKEVLLNFGRNLVGHYCTDINKRVYEHATVWTIYGQCSQSSFDEYGNPIEYRDEDINILSPNIEEMYENR